MSGPKYAVVGEDPLIQLPKTVVPEQDLTLE